MLSRELSQGPVLAKAKRLGIPPHELKLRPVIAVASATARSVSGPKGENGRT